MAKKEKISSSISKADSYEAIGEFWDEHDFTDFDNEQNPDVDFNISRVVPIDMRLFSSIEKEAKLRGVEIETLINLWLQEKLHEQKEMPSAA